MHWCLLSVVSAQSNAQPVFDPDVYTFHMLPGADGSSAALAVGTVVASDSDAGDVITFGLRASDPADRMYMTGDGNDALYRVDADDFTAVRVDASLSAFGVGETAPAGTAWHNGKLYMVGAVTDALHTLDPDTGRAARVGTAAQFGVRREHTTRSRVAQWRVVHARRHYRRALYKLDTLTGEASRVGSANQFGQNRNDPAALASFGSPAQLYALFADASTLYRLDTDTGTATSLSTTASPDSSTPQAMAVHNGKLYAVGSNPARVWELRISGDTATPHHQRGDRRRFQWDDTSGKTSPHSGIATGYAQPTVRLLDQLVHRHHHLHRRLSPPRRAHTARPGARQQNRQRGRRHRLGLRSATPPP